MQQMLYKTERRGRAFAKSGVPRVRKLGRNEQEQEVGNQDHMIDVVVGQGIVRSCAPHIA